MLLALGNLLQRCRERKAFAGLKSHRLASVNEKIESSPTELRVTGDLFLGM